MSAAPVKCVKPGNKHAKACRSCGHTKRRPDVVTAHRRESGITPDLTRFEFNVGSTASTTTGAPPQAGFRSDALLRHSPTLKDIQTFFSSFRRPDTAVQVRYRIATGLSPLDDWDSRRCMVVPVRAHRVMVGGARDHLNFSWHIMIARWEMGAQRSLAVEPEQSRTSLPCRRPPPWTAPAPCTSHPNLLRSLTLPS